jgi:alanine racemase
MSTSKPNTKKLGSASKDSSLGHKSAVSGVAKLHKEQLHSWVTVDTQAIVANVQFLTKRAKQYDKDFMVMVKADAYGHGIVEISRLVEELGTRFLGVASIEEGVTVREHGIHTPILLFTEPSAADLPLLAEYRIIPVVSSLHFLDTVVNRPTNQSTPFHLKINSGLNRYGLKPHDLPEALTILSGPRPALEGMLTHYSTGEDTRVTEQEFNVFWDAVGRIRDAGHNPRHIHASNSAATAWFNEAKTNLVRLGMATYGLQPDSARLLPLRPALSWYARLTSISRISKGEKVGYGGSWKAERDSTVGVISVGYSDGFRRTPRHQQYVLCRGEHLPIIGHVMMNHAIVDLTATQNVLKVGDEVVLAGQQESANISLEVIAEQLGTTNEEVATTISSRLQRYYV